MFTVAIVIYTYIFKEARPASWFFAPLLDWIFIIGVLETIVK